MKKTLLFALCVFATLLFTLTACNETLSKPYEGIWEPVDGEWESFVITKDSMYGVVDGKHYLACHYRVLNSNTIKLKRSWLNPGDVDYTEKVGIYFDESKNLVIENYTPTFAAIFPPLYSDLVLRKK